MTKINMLLLKDINQRDYTKAELLEDKVNDTIKYFYNGNQFREGKIVEILQHGTLIVKNKYNITNDRITKSHVILNMSLLERKITNNLIVLARKEFEDNKENKLQVQIYNLNNKLTYLVNTLLIIMSGVIYYKLIHI
jgi:hypothetical protein